MSALDEADTCVKNSGIFYQIYIYIYICVYVDMLVCLVVHEPIHTPRRPQVNSERVSTLANYFKRVFKHMENCALYIRIRTHT